MVSALEEVEPLSLDGVINGSWHSIPENMKVTFIIHGGGGGGGEWSNYPCDYLYMILPSVGQMDWYTS